MEVKEKSKSNFSCFAITPFVVSLIHAFVKNRKTSRASDKTLPLPLPPSCLLLSERTLFWLPFTETPEHSRDLGRRSLFFFLIYFVPGTTILGNLAEMILFNSHKKFERQVYSRFIHKLLHMKISSFKNRK